MNPNMTPIMNGEKAEAIAVRAVEFLAGQGELLSSFLQQSGGSADDLRSAIGESSLWLAVLDFLLLDDAVVREFAEAAGLSPEMPMAARQYLGGEMHWT